MENKALESIMEEAIANSIWRPAPITDEPEIYLSRWQIMEVDGIRYFLGHEDRWRSGRISSDIVTFDEKTKRGVTKSGRVYQLHGNPGIDPDAEYVLGMWLSVNKINREDIKWINL